MRKLIVTCFAVLLLVTMFMGRAMFTSMAKEETTAAPYYKSIQIREGDSLWKIARQHNVSVDDLKRWNGVDEKTLRAGSVLVVEQ